MPGKMAVVGPGSPDLSLTQGKPFVRRDRAIFTLFLISLPQEIALVLRGRERDPSSRRMTLLTICLTRIFDDGNGDEKNSPSLSDSGLDIP
jgi:hypothetical protein